MQQSRSGGIRIPPKSPFEKGGLAMSLIREAPTFFKGRSRGIFILKS